MRLSSLEPKLLACFAALLAVGVYLNALGNGFALDDVYIIQLNSRVHDATDLRSILLTPYWAFRGQELGLYRPGAILLYAFQWAVGNGAPWLFHAVSLLLHGIATVLVFYLLARFTRPLSGFAGALIFAVHPVHAEAVANIVGQAEILAATLVLAACLVHSHRPDGVAVAWPRRLVLACLFVPALTTKESAVVLPALLVIVDLMQRRVRISVRGLAEYADAMLMPLFLLAAALAAYLLVRFDVMDGLLIGTHAAPSMPYISEEYRVLNALRAFPEFLRLLFFPQELAADYHPAVLLPVVTVRPMVILGGVLLALVAVLALVTPWRPRLGFPAAWFLISILTVSNLFFPIGVLVAERTLYLPSVALSALVAFGLAAAVGRASTRTRRLIPLLLALVVFLFGWRTWLRNPDWQSTETVLLAHVRDHPHSYRSQWMLATTFESGGDPDRAEAHYIMAERIYAGDAQFLTEYGEFLLRRGRTAEAVDLLERAYAIQPTVHGTLMLLSQAYVAAGQYADALRTIAAAERLEPDALATMSIRAAAHTGLGEYGPAAAAWRVAIARSELPTWQMWAFLSRSLASYGLEAEAIAALDRARALTASPDALTLLDEIARALERGCYDVASSDTVTESDGTRRPGCDPLGDWIGIMAVPRATVPSNRQS